VVQPKCSVARHVKSVALAALRSHARAQKGADLIDDAGTLSDQSLAHTMDRLRVELAIALTNKLARIAWSVLANGRSLETRMINHAIA
jgi:hypothetical protein